MSNDITIPMAFFSDAAGWQFRPFLLDTNQNLKVVASGVPDPTTGSTGSVSMSYITTPTTTTGLTPPSDYLVTASFPWLYDPGSGEYVVAETAYDSIDTLSPVGRGSMTSIAKNYLYDDITSAYSRQRALIDSADALSTGFPGLAGTVSRLQVYSETTASYDRVREGDDSADGQITGGLGLLSSVSRPMIFNGSTYDRVVSLADNANGQAAQVTGLQGVVARLQAIDTQAGTFDRLGCEGTDQDANPALNAGVLVVNTHPRMWNGADYDRVRGNEDVSLQAPTAQAAASTVLSGDQTNYNARGIKLIVNVTAITSGDTLTVTLRGKDVVSGVYYTILASVAIGAVGSYPLTVFPGAPVSANVSANDQLPRTWDVEYVTAGANAVTFSVGASVLL